MRSTRYEAINAPIKLHLQYNQLTVGELSNILRHWQALLRSSWRESYEFQHTVEAPDARVFTVAMSAENSVELISDYAVQALLVANLTLGPVTDWTRQARLAYAFLTRIWEAQATTRSETDDRVIRETRAVTVTGGSEPAMTFPADMLENAETARRVVDIWRIANGGDIVMAIEDVDETVSDEEPDGNDEDQED